MSKYTEDIKKLEKLVGSKENIASLTHCATRLRFVLVDPDKADVEGISELASVKGSFTQAGQFQIVIGNDVSTFYQEFVKETGIEGASREEAKAAAKKNMNLLQRAVTNLAEIFAPIIPAIIVGGLILGFRNVIGDIQMFEGGTQTLTQISTFWNGVNNFLWLIGEAIFVFLPVGITWSVCRKMGVDQMLGIVLGITLVSPQLLSAGSVATAESIPFWDFGFAQIPMIGYQSQVIPAILVGFAFAYLYRLFKKITPEVISMIIVPFFSLVPAVLLAHTVLGPLGRMIGDGVAAFVYGGFNSSFGWLFGGLYGMIYPLLVITGLHHSMLPVDLQIIASTGSSFIFPIVALCNIGQATAVAAYAVIHRKSAREQQIAVPAAVSAYLGVTEPAMFGVNLKYFYPFIGAIIGSGIASTIAMLTNTLANSVGVGGLPAVLSMKPQSMLSFTMCMAVCIVVAFAATWLLSKTKLARYGTKQ